MTDGVPCAIRRTPVLATGLLMNVPGECLHVLERSGRQNAVTEIENVTGASARTGEHLVGGGEDAVERSEQQRRIEIALDAAVESDPLPGIVERCVPIGSGDVGACITEV